MSTSRASEGRTARSRPEVAPDLPGEPPLRDFLGEHSADVAASDHTDLLKHGRAPFPPKAGCGVLRGRGTSTAGLWRFLPLILVDS